jgi:hypothetical protein
MVDALALRDDEGRGKLRKATGNCKRVLIRRCPNGETQHCEAMLPFRGRKPRELKHLSTWRKRKQLVIPQVVASERGEAQTGVVRHTGVVGPASRLNSEVECVGKHNQRG